jgi:hypothetical protein
VLVAVAVVVWYFTAPLDRPWSAVTWLAFAGGLLLVLAVFGWQIRAVVRSPNPRLRAVGALVLSFPLLVQLFASAYFLMAQDRPESFTEPLTRLDALYLAMTIFSTVGFGDISAQSQAARVLVILRMLADLCYVALFARALIEAARIGVHRRAGERSSTDRG